MDNLVELKKEELVEIEGGSFLAGLVIGLAIGFLIGVLIVEGSYNG